MAGVATDIFEFRATAGSANAGGGFDTASGGTDYSNQDSAQLQLTDLVTSGIGVTTLTSATGGFTAVMVGNYIQIRSGTNVTAGFYRVTAHTDTNTVTLDRAPDDGVGGIASGLGDLGGALDVITNAFLDDANVVVAGNKIHVKNDGTMTLTGAIAGTKDGTTTTPIYVLGYNTSREDNPTSTNRPTIAGGANTFVVDNYWTLANIIFTGTAANVARADSASCMINCKATNSSGSSNRAAMAGLFSFGIMVKCEAISTNGYAVNSLGNGARYFYNYFHDSVRGMTGGSSFVLLGNVFDTLTVGYFGTADSSNVYIGNTFYNCTTAFQETTAYNVYMVNNIFDTCTDAVKWNNSGTVIGSNIFDYNVWFNNTSDISWDDGSSEDNSAKGVNAVNTDPKLNDPANGDFTLQSGSSAIDTGLDATDAGVTV